MARFETAGLDDLFREMELEGELVGDTADEMLMAAAEVVAEEWRKSAERHKHRDTGDMIKSIGYPRQPKTVRDVRYIDIYPQGRDEKGIRNAEKAFILNYGTSKKPGSHWIDEADANSAEPVQRVMERIWSGRKLR